MATPENIDTPNFRLATGGYIDNRLTNINYGHGLEPDDQTHDAQNRKREGLKAFGSGRGPHRGPPAAAPPAAARTESAEMRKRVHVGYVTITGTRKTLPPPRNKQNRTYPAEEQTKPPQNKKPKTVAATTKGTAAA